MSLPDYEIITNKRITTKLWAIIEKFNGVEQFLTFYKTYGATYAEELRVITTENDGFAIEIKYADKIEIAPFYHSRIKIAIVNFMERGIARVVWSDSPTPLALDLDQESRETTSNYHLACALWTFIAWYKGSTPLADFMYPGAHSVHSYAPKNILAFGVWYKDAPAIKSHTFCAENIHKAMEQFIDTAILTIEWK